MKADWTAIGHEYITSNMSIRDIANKHHLSSKSVGLKASAEGWAEQREKYRGKVSKAVDRKMNATKSVEARADRIVAWQDKVNNACDNALEALLAQSEEAKKYPPSMMQSWLRALETAMRIRREMSGYISPADRAKIDIAQKELQIKQEEHERNGETREPITITIDTDTEKYAK